MATLRIFGKANAPRTTPLAGPRLLAFEDLPLKGIRFCANLSQEAGNRDRRVFPNPSKLVNVAWRGPRNPLINGLKKRLRAVSDEPTFPNSRGHAAQDIAQEIRANPSFDIEEALEVLLLAMKPEPDPVVTAVLYRCLLGDQ